MNRLILSVLFFLLSGCLNTGGLQDMKKRNPRVIEMNLLESGESQTGMGVAPFLRPTPGAISSDNNDVSNNNSSNNKGWLEFSGLRQKGKNTNSSLYMSIPFGKNDTMTPKGSSVIKSFIDKLKEDGDYLNQRIKITSSTNVLDRRDSLSNEVISVLLSEGIILENIDVYTQPNPNESQGDFVLIESARSSGE